jgi:predicted anti-sigma-YlaC factor YlaD
VKKEMTMKCTEIQELLPDLAAGLSSAAPEVDHHLRACAACRETLAAFRKTMALLDEWQAPEPSPYFDVRLSARLREEASHQPARWLAWIRRPALAASLAVVLIAGVTVYRMEQKGGAEGPVVAAKAEPGTAVSDLQALDKNHEIFANSDLLDDLQVQQDVNANP